MLAFGSHLGEIGSQFGKFISHGRMFGSLLRPFCLGVICNHLGVLWKIWESFGVILESFGTSQFGRQMGPVIWDYSVVIWNHLGVI